MTWIGSSVEGGKHKWHLPLFHIPPGVLILSSHYFFPKSSWKTLFLNTISLLIAWLTSSTIFLSCCCADTPTCLSKLLSPHLAMGEAFPRQCCLRSWHCLHSQLSTSRNVKSKQFLMLAQSIIYPSSTHGTPVSNSLLIDFEAAWYCSALLPS